MRISRRSVLVGLTGLFVKGQEKPVARWERVEVEGVIRRVQLEPGGVPSLELETRDGTKRILLGSRRYLMEHDFNPKAGVRAVVKAFRRDGTMVAQEVSIPSEKVSLRLRTEEGIPLWRGGRRGRE
jgi:hypothetical protein